MEKTFAKVASFDQSEVLTETFACCSWMFYHTLCNANIGHNSWGTWRMVRESLEDCFLHCVKYSLHPFSTRFLNIAAGEWLRLPRGISQLYNTLPAISNRICSKKHLLTRSLPQHVAFTTPLHNVFYIHFSSLPACEPPGEGGNHHSCSSGGGSWWPPKSTQTSQEQRSTGSLGGL